MRVTPSPLGPNLAIDAIKRARQKSLQRAVGRQRPKRTPVPQNAFSIFF